MARFQLPSSLHLTRNYVGGEFVATDKRFANICPVDGSTLAEVCEADRGLVDRAVDAARRAVDGEWGSMHVDDRATCLHRVADLIERRFGDFLQAEVADTGRPLEQARKLDIYRAMHNFRTFADLGKHAHTDFFETRLPDGTQLINYTRRKPLGVIASISPWNLPILSLTWKAAPALICGNAIVCKPSEETPSTATLLAEVFDEAGVPAGAFNVIHGFGPGSAGEALTTHPGIDAVTFTGESRTGSAIMKAVADGVKEVSFELGGKNAAVVFEDADFDAAVDGIIRSSFTNAGQVCLCSERVYVHRSIFDRFVAELKRRTESLKVGWPDEEGVFMGSLISREHRDKVVSYFDLAVREGATVVTGGRVPVFGDERDNGAWVLPTIWTGLPDDARCMREEVFGPVCHLSPFDSDEEVMARVNDSVYGLAASIWTTTLSRAHRLAPRFRVGIVWVNSWFSRDLRTPFGGSKLSGIGREGGRHSLDFYSETTNICVRI